MEVTKIERYNRELLKELRTQLGFTQKELAKLAGVSLSIVTKIETSIDYIPKVTTAARLAYVLGKKVDDFIKKED